MSIKILFLFFLVQQVLSNNLEILFTKTLNIFISYNTYINHKN